MRSCRLAVALTVLLLACNKENSVWSGGAAPSDVKNLGSPCDASKPSGFCGGGVCIAGLCRTKCETDANCKGSVCLTEKSGEPGGCRLPSEAFCSGTTTCTSQLLRCGLDGTCRTPCTPSQPCPRNDQLCIEGACYGQLEGEGPEWLCGGAGPGDLRCDGVKLQACDVGGLGWVDVGACATAALCAKSVASLSVTCTSPVCAVGEKRCTGTKLERCSVGREAWEFEATCQTNELCELGKAQTGSCAGPACAPGDAHCTGLDVMVCNQARTGFEVSQNCPFVCKNAACQGVCVPGATECTTAGFRECSVEGEWGSQSPQPEWGYDQDGDGHAHQGWQTITSCDKPTEPPAECPTCSPDAWKASIPTDDCDDANPEIHPGQTESCDGIDNDCTGAADEGLLTEYCQNKDGDGYCALSKCSIACSAPADYVEKGLCSTMNDCRDNDISAYPGAQETCGDSIDKNCDGNDSDPYPVGDPCEAGQVGTPCFRQGQKQCDGLFSTKCSVQAGTPDNNWHDTPVPNANYDWNCDTQAETLYPLDPAVSSCNSCGPDTCGTVCHAKKTQADCENALKVELPAGKRYVACSGSTGACGQAISVVTCVWQANTYCEYVVSGCCGSATQLCR